MPQREVLEAQLRADVLVHEQYQGSSGDSIDQNGGQDHGQGVVPTSSELENYTRLLNNPGAIQPHGYFFLIDESSAQPDMRLPITAVSDNVKSVFGVEPRAVLGKSLECLFVEKNDIIRGCSGKDLSIINPITVTTIVEGSDISPQFVNLIIHRSSSGMLVDVEHMDPMENSFAAHQRVRVAIERLNTTDSVQSMCQQVVEEVSSTTGYSRVMLYKFYEDQHGEVVAECKDDNIEDSWLGLHFPATDVPQRTRDQLKTELVRMIVDSSSSHSEIVMAKKGHDSKSISLMGSTLRRAHQCHLEYLRNMKTTASLVFAIVVKDDLWGMVVCHHDTPRFISYQMRMAGEFLTQAFAMRLSSQLDMEDHHRNDRCLQLHAKLCDIMYQQGHNPGLRVRGLVDSKPNLMDLIPGVNGAAVQFAGKVRSVGECPDIARMEKICAAVHQAWQMQDKRSTRAIESLREIDEKFVSLVPTTAGVLCVPVGVDGLMLFFRPELCATIRWGGNPNAPAQQLNGAMHPRGSFDIFTSSVRDRCSPWLKWEVEAATGLGHLVSDITQSVDTDEVRSNVLVRLNNERMQTQNDREAVVSEMSSLIDSVKAPVLAVDSFGIIIQWNSMLSDLTSQNKDDVIGKPLDRFVPEGHASTIKDVLQKALNRVDSEGVELSIIRADATSLPLNQRRVELKVNTSGRFNAAGACKGVVFVGLDVTASNAKTGLAAQMEQQMEAVVHMTAALNTGAGIGSSESSYEFHPDKDSSLLGEGSFGKTHRMKGKLDSELYAVKMINVKKAEKNGVQLDALKREVHMLTKLNSPHIIRYFTCYMYKKEKYFCIVMELLEGGTLGHLIEDTRGTVNRIPDDKVMSITSQIAKALEHIHSKRMMHRDIKPHNILLSMDGSEAKVTDFGLACVMSSAAAASRAGTLSYASPEKAGAKGYDSKDDIWALGCIVAEMVTGVSMTSRCGGGIFAFNQPLIARTVQQVKTINEGMGRIVERLLASDPRNRPSATELLEIMEAKPQAGVNVDDAEELCEEYICAICQNLVLDAHTVCVDEHVFCGACLNKWLENKNECPTCRKAAKAPHRLRIINNAVEKLAARVLDAQGLADRSRRKAELAELEAALQRKRDEESAAEEAAARAAEEARQRQGSAAAPENAEPVSATPFWKFAQAELQYGMGCTLLRHTGCGALIEVFHSNGWYRFRLKPGEEARWCNSCGNLGASDFGAQHIVVELDAGGGADIPSDGLGLLDETGYWFSRVANGLLVIENSDEEALFLDSAGGFIWMSHPGMNKAIIARGGDVSSSSREEAVALLGI